MAVYTLPLTVPAEHVFIHSYFLTPHAFIADAKTDEAKANVYCFLADGCAALGKFDRAREYLTLALIHDHEKKFSNYIEFYLSECPEQTNGVQQNQTTFFQQPQMGNNHRPPPYTPAYVENTGRLSSIK